ncbi:MAG: AsmA family protein [Alphaproteobacteria bacterium]|nr:AsmA family protein [Alphaproteobacteria bacterium]
MARILTLLGIVVVAIVGAAIAAVLLIPVDVYRGQIEAAAQQATGRELKIAGDLGLTFYPTIGIRAEQVTFQNTPSGKAPRMAEMDSLVVGVQVLPLLSGDLRITELVLEKPVINLEISKSGKPNWEFETQGAAPAAAPTGGEGEPSSGGGSSVSELSFGDVRIVDGTVSYSDLGAGTTETIEAINVSIALPSLDDPLEADGSLTYKGETLNIDASAETPRALLEGGATPIALEIASRLIDATFTGSLDSAKTALNGGISLSADSVRDLATWLGTALPKGEGFQALSLKGTIASAGTRADFKDLTLSFDNMAGTGALALDTGGAVPYLSGALDLNQLDLNPYLADSGSGTGATASSAPLSGGGSSGGGRWSSEPIDASGLKAINADLTFTVGAFRVQKINMGKSLVTLVLKNGVMTVNLKELDLYQGSGAGVFVVDGSRGAPTIRTKMTLDAIQALPLLTDAADMSWLEGLGTVTLDVAGTGGSQAAIMRSLTGNGAISFVDGSIRGVNLAEIARNIEGALTGSAIGESAKTDFAQLGGTFKITNGVLTNTDLSLLNPFVRMLGNGAIDIGAQTMKYRVEPRAVSSIEGQGGQGDLAGVGIPFLISGPWNNLSFAPDLEGVANQAIQDALSGKGIQIPGLPGLGGQTPSEGEGATGQESKPASPIDLLPGLLGGQKPAEEKPAEEKPAEEKPAEEKPLIPGFPGLTR